MPDCLSLFVHVSVHLSSVSASNILLFSPLSWCLCSHRNWQTFWRSVTWCSQACSVSRCCWSSWLWGSLATSKTPIMASTASLSSSGEILLPSDLRLCTECSPRLAGVVRLILKMCSVCCSKTDSGKSGQDELFYYEAMLITSPSFILNELWYREGGIFKSN